VYQFQTSRGPDRDAEVVEGEEGSGNWEGCHPLQPTRGSGGAS